MEMLYIEQAHLCGSEFITHQDLLHSDARCTERLLWTYGQGLVDLAAFQRLLPSKLMCGNIWIIIFTETDALPLNTINSYSWQPSEDPEELRSSGSRSFVKILRFAYFCIPDRWRSLEIL